MLAEDGGPFRGTCGSNHCVLGRESFSGNGALGGGRGGGRILPNSTADLALLMRTAGARVMPSPNKAVVAPPASAMARAPRLVDARRAPSVVAIGTCVVRVCRCVGGRGVMRACVCG